VPAQEIAAALVELGDPPVACGSVHHAWTNEIGPLAAKAAGDVNEADCLGNILPFASAHAHSIAKMQPVAFATQADRSDLLSVSRPLRDARPARAQTVVATQSINIDRPVAFRCVAAKAAAQPRSDAAHHQPLDSNEILWKPRAAR
jgi:hypothetical protein